MRTFLDETFPGTWAGNGGPNVWPQHFPDIKPLDFFLWGYVKDYICRTSVDDSTTFMQG
jgi:hypothetical protein